MILMVFQDISDRDDDDEHVGIDEIGIGSFPGCCAPDRTGTPRPRGISPNLACRLGGRIDR